MGIGALVIAAVTLLPSCAANRPPGAKIVTDTIFDTDYLRWTFFSLDTPVNGSLPAPHFQITNLRVYVDDANPQNNTGSRKCRATIYPYSPEDTARYTGDVFDGYFDLKTLDTDYAFTSQPGVIRFITPISSNCAIGVAYIESQDTVGGNEWWNPETGESLLVLKLVKPTQMDTASRTWSLWMRNVYGPSVEGIWLDSTKLVRRLPGENPTEFDENGHRFLYLVGLDPDDDGVVVWPQLDRARGHAYLFCGNSFPFIAQSLTVKDSICGSDNSGFSPKYRFIVKYTKIDTSDALR